VATNATPSSAAARQAKECTAIRVLSSSAALAVPVEFHKVAAVGRERGGTGDARQRARCSSRRRRDGSEPTPASAMAMVPRLNTVILVAIIDVGDSMNIDGGR
jgi:hypothetical protein